MLSATPLVASRGGGVIEIVDDGQTGVLFEPGNVKSLNQAIAGLLRDSERAGSIARRAREHAIRNFGLESMLSGIEAQVREVQAA
jgi:glycosyltransferase involved in cell wall biosynthesis